MSYKLNIMLFYKILQIENLDYVEYFRNELE